MMTLQGYFAPTNHFTVSEPQNLSVDASKRDFETQKSREKFGHGSNARMLILAVFIWQQINLVMWVVIICCELAGRIRT